jgi:DNA-binding SARP family transcriptional activator
MLLLHVNNSVSVERLIDATWDKERPQTARNQVQRCIHRLRERLSDAGLPVIVTEPAGYRAEIDPKDLDLLEFRRLVGEARAAAASGRRSEAVEKYRAALALWRGPAFADVDSDLVRRAAMALDEERAQATEECIATELANGGAGELVAELTDLVARHPHREGLHRALMLALYRAGRQGEALVAYRRLRRLLHDDLGIEPGDDTQELHRAILNRDSGLEAARPTPSSLQPPTPRELPADVVGFTGRADALKALDELLPNGNVTAPVVISAIAGTAGVGKTALAVHWAHRVADRFPHGQLYLNLRGYAAGAPLRPIEALSTLLRSLGVPSEQIPAEEAEASARYRTLLADRGVLVVLDNARSADQVRLLLPGSPGCLALVTSRDRLAGLVARDGARRLTLDVLTVDEACRLVTHLLGVERVQAEPEAVAELAHACAYLPLALRIATAIVQEHPSRHVNRLAADLAAGSRLDALEIPDDEASAVRAAFDLSYRGIPEPAQRMFRLLGLVPGPDVTSPAAAALADVSQDEARRLLGRLASAHLVNEHAPSRYTFHDLLREYAQDCTMHEDNEDQHADAVERLLGWYHQAADAAADMLYPADTTLRHPANDARERTAAFAHRGQALSWLDAERSNLVAGITHAAKHGPRATAVLLADLLRPYLWNGMHSLDGLAIGRASLAAAQSGGSHHDQASAQHTLADAYLMRGDHQEAAEWYRQASALARRAGWHRGEAAAENNLATVCMDWGEVRAADRHLTRALALNRRFGDHGLVAFNLGNLGYVRCDLGDISSAVSLWNDTLAIFRRLGNTRGIGTVLANLGRANRILGLLDQALDCLARALPLLREVGDRGGESYALRIQAAVHHDTGRYHEGLEYANLAMSRVRDTGDRRLESDVWSVMAALRLSLGDHNDAVTCYERAHDIARPVPFQRTVALLGLGAARTGLGQYEQASVQASQALEAARKIGYRVLEGQALTLLAEIQLRDGLPDEADRLAGQALDSHRGTGHRLGEARTLVVRGRIRHTTGEAPAAYQCWLAARDLFDDVGAPPPADLPEGWQRA